MTVPDSSDPFDVAALLGDRPYVDARSPPADREADQDTPVERGAEPQSDTGSE